MLVMHAIIQMHLIVLVINLRFDAVVRLVHTGIHFVSDIAGGTSAATTTHVYRPATATTLRSTTIPARSATTTTLLEATRSSAAPATLASTAPTRSSTATTLAGVI